MSEIQEWLQKFRHCWIQRNINDVMDLFTDDVQYYETPTRKLENKKEIREEWKSVRDQESISLELEKFSSCENRHTVRWSLEYSVDDDRRSLSGVYLIVLDSNGKCKEFWQYCQTE